MEEFDIGIVGLGALGSSAAYHAASKNVKVVAFEQFELGHVRGSSHDTSRIVRTSYGTPEYVRLAKSAYADWRALERATGIPLLQITGGVTFLAKDAVPSAADWGRSLYENDVPYEILTPRQVSERWPQFSIPDGVETVYCADTGIVHASRSVATMQQLARSYGALLKDRTRVERIQPQKEGGVIIYTSNGRYRVKKVILTADAWTNRLLMPLGIEIPLKVSQEQVTYFKPSNPSNFEAPKFPVWIWGPDPWFYGFPCYGEPTIKAGRHCGENYMTPEERSFVPSEKLLQQLTNHLNHFMPDSGRQTLRTVTCQYATTPEQDFVISPLDKYQDVIVGLGSAHAFKFAPAFGRVLADLAVDGQTKDDISKFVIPLPEQSSSKL